MTVAVDAVVRAWSVGATPDRDTRRDNNAGDVAALDQQVAAFDVDGISGTAEVLLQAEIGETTRLGSTANGIGPRCRNVTSPRGPSPTIPTGLSSTSDSG